MRVNQPANQIKLTNVSIVRLKKGGKRFEIACYKNKVQEWRNGVETDIDDVVQVNNVFINVSKGEVARSEDLKKSFGKLGTEDIVKEILQRGEIQVGEKEREHELSNLWKEIATLISERCVDPETQMPIPVGMIEKAMHEAGFSVKPGKTAKSQTGECIRLIQSNSKLPIQRARMRIKVVIANEQSEAVREEVFTSAEKVEEEVKGETEWEATLLIDPSQFKVLNELIQKKAEGKGRLETLVFANVASTSGA
ncbi:putative Shwachman-Bodian-diamond syndrome protein [Serendipita vermifera]|nr:putative Shwachman-Bodian-diamond syndrome protein [Serendipita vermifera]